MKLFQLESPQLNVYNSRKNSNSEAVSEEITDSDAFSALCITPSIHTA
jgi:hypothetical protein